MLCWPPCYVRPVRRLYTFLYWSADVFGKELVLSHASKLVGCIIEKRCLKTCACIVIKTRRIGLTSEICNVWLTYRVFQGSAARKGEEQNRKVERRLHASPPRPGGRALLPPCQAAVPPPCALAWWGERSVARPGWGRVQVPFHLPVLFFSLPRSAPLKYPI